jgi:purine-cytosine permease-like protein
VKGAVVPLLLVIVMYVGFFAGGSVLAGQAVGELTHLGETPGIVIFAPVTAVTATTSSFCTGPLVQPLGGADISWIVGLAVPAALFLGPAPGRNTGASPPANAPAAPYLEQHGRP